MKRHSTMSEIHSLAEKFGWSVEYDNYGQVMLYTGLISDDGNKLRELEEKDLLANDDNH